MKLKTKMLLGSGIPLFFVALFWAIYAPRTQHALLLEQLTLKTHSIADLLGITAGANLAYNDAGGAKEGLTLAATTRISSSRRFEPARAMCSHRTATSRAHCSSPREEVGRNPPWFVPTAR